MKKMSDYVIMRLDSSYYVINITFAHLHPQTNHSKAVCITNSDRRFFMQRCRDLKYIGASCGRLSKMRMRESSSSSTFADWT